MAMLSFDIRSLEAQAATVDEQLSADDAVWEEGDPRPDSAVHVTGRLSAAGTGQFYWHGRIAGDVTVPCRRCLSDAHARVEDESHIIYAETGDEEIDDPDVYPLDPSDRYLDLRPAIREEWLLAQPRFVICRDDCQGLCPRCGADLNAGPCACPPQTDSRWAELRKANA
jgi:DUF177 domain-containing protein